MLTNRASLSTYSSVTSSLVTTRDSTSVASASNCPRALSNDSAGTRIAMAPLCLDERSELTTHPPSSPAKSTTLLTVRATSSTTSDMRAVWTMILFRANGAGCTLPPPLVLGCWRAAGVGAAPGTGGAAAGCASMTSPDSGELAVSCVDEVAIVAPESFPPPQAATAANCSVARARTATKTHFILM